MKLRKMWRELTDSPQQGFWTYKVELKEREADIYIFTREELEEFWLIAQKDAGNDYHKTSIAPRPFQDFLNMSEIEEEADEFMKEQGECE